MDDRDTIQNHVTDYFRDQTKSQDERQELANWLIAEAMRIRGYNNYESDYVSGEKFFLTKILPKLSPTVCIDVGANVGEYSKGLLECTNAKVYAFEPVRQAYETLSLLKNNYPNRVIIERQGVGAKEERLPIFYNENATAHSSFSQEVQEIPYVNSTASEEVDVISLDHYFGKIDCPIDFIKIDTEGFEYEVLLGARELLLWRRPKAVQIEFNWHQLFKGKSVYTISKLLEGYRAYQLLPNLLIERDPKDPFSNFYAFSNFVFLRNDLV
jgi:FkbM family methyltransferase